MRKLLYSFLLVLFFVSNTSQLLAQDTTPVTTTGASSNIPSEDSSSSTNDFDDFILNPPQFPQNPKNPEDSNYITDFTPTVEVTFPGLEGTDYEVCLSTNYCVLANQAFAYSNAVEKINILTQVGIDKDAFDGLKKYKDVFEGNTITVCGDGEHNLKAAKDKGCDSNRDYFHAGNFYLITIYANQSKQKVAVARAGFYVSHDIPIVNLFPIDNLTPTGQKFTLTLSQPLKKPGKNRNNYQVVLEGPGYKNEECSTFKSTSEPATFRFPADDDEDKLKTDGFTIPGTYLFKINEQINEKGGFRQVGDMCQGGFTYMHITCTIGKDIKRNNCRKVIDPKGEDGKELLNLLNIINGSGEQKVDLPCNKNEPFVKNPLDCDSIDTSIGSIDVDPIGFITRIFSIVLSIGGLGAMILIIYSGYRLLISRGDKEKIQGARETMTAAIVGLLFIVFSLVILSVIAGDILKVPGFS